MTEPVEPPPAPTPRPTASAAMAAGDILQRLDTSARLIVGGSAAAVVILLLGAIVGAWALDGYALLVLVLAVIALVIGYLAATTDRADGWPVPQRDLVLAAGIVMVVISTLNLVETLFDLDQIDDERGGIIGLILTILLVVAAVVTLVGGLRTRPVTRVASDTVRHGERGIRLALGGLAIDLVAWLVMLSVSVYALGSTSSFGLAAGLLAVLVLVLGADRDGGWKIPIPAAWIAVGLAIIATLTLLDQFGQYNAVNERYGLDAIDSIAFFAHAIGTLLILGGAVLAAIDHQRSVGLPSMPATPTGGDQA
jgi:hypothetical protein